ncbi:hypothetical protein V6R21_06375 [Limibacter armeniacum]|uniref:hypothetical protein n=1 Tax=Limibacter armeniacum TaxID=466084 RepID=UPI002FE51FE1
MTAIDIILSIIVIAFSVNTLVLTYKNQQYTRQHKREVLEKLKRERFKLMLFENGVIKLMRAAPYQTNFQEVETFSDLNTALEAKVQAEMQRDLRDGTGDILTIN